MPAAMYMIRTLSIEVAAASRRAGQLIIFLRQKGRRDAMVALPRARGRVVVFVSSPRFCLRRCARGEARRDEKVCHAHRCPLRRTLNLPPCPSLPPTFSAPPPLILHAQYIAPTEHSASSLISLTPPPLPLLSQLTPAPPLHTTPHIA
ncbi:hypothetical protein CALVIDRAFT_370231 [Calocera viscosa TUFC12733]|uniref:Uncharacterized protein n=1 Tax=Calocera viscosa (strain TUFC12733) TaxID=1330018 RepID=A0A167GY36_CALVF|nr:hypothetical protein CALVIDRAFT_370231 [Calocera viscosa TUFC12733]